MDIINQLIDGLADKSNNLTDIMIKTKVLSYKLKNQELIDWIDNELNGYDNNIVPRYRRIACQVIGTVSNGYQTANNYPIPLIGVNEELRNQIQNVNLTQSVSSLEDFGNGKPGSKMAMNIPPEMYGYLSKDFEGGYSIVYAKRVIERSQVLQVITVIRTRLLDFLLKLNDEFSEQKDLKTLAEGDAKQKVASLFHSSVFGNNTTIIVGDNNIQKVSNIMKGDILSLKDFLKEKGMDDKDLNELSTVLENDHPNHIKKEFGPKLRDWISSMLNKALDGSWSIGIGAAGNILAEGIKQYYGW